MIQLPQPAQQRSPRPVSSPQLTAPAPAAGWDARATTQRQPHQQHQQSPVGDDELNPALAQLAKTNAAKLLTGQSTGRISARTAARQERLNSRSSQKHFAQLAQRKLTPLELAVLPGEDELQDVAPEQPDVPVLPEYMVAKVKEIGGRFSSAESYQQQLYRKNSKGGMLRMRLSGQSLAKLYWFELRAPKLMWRTPPSGGKRFADGELRGRMILPDLVEQVSHERGSAELVLHCGAQRMHLLAVNEEQASQWQKVLKRAAFAPSPAARSGKALWAFLRPRLQLVVAMQEQWGNVHSLYGRTSSLFENIALPPTVRDPESEFSAVWDICQLFLLLYVSFTVPYRTCFNIHIELWTFGFFFDVLVDIYCKHTLTFAIPCAVADATECGRVQLPSSTCIHHAVLTDLGLNFRTVSLLSVSLSVSL